MAGGSPEVGRSVLSRVQALLNSFDVDRRRLSLTELSERSGLALTTTHRLLRELQDSAMVVRGADGDYEIGEFLWHLGPLAPVNRGLREIALPAMHDLHAVTHETVHLAIRQGAAVVYVERIQGTVSTPVVNRPGTAMPLHATAVGTVLLAYAPPEVIEQALRAPQRVTPYPMTEPERLQRELVDVRRHGYARMAEEMASGATSVAVPVLDSEDRVVAALGVVVRSSRRDIAGFLIGLQVAARSIGRALGSTGTPARPLSSG